MTDADRAHVEAPRHSNHRALDAAPHVAEEDLSCSAADAAACAADAVQIAAEGCSDSKKEECRQQAALLRCVFGGTYRLVVFNLVVFNPTWLTAIVLELAEAIYSDRRHADLPILADALEDAGCTNRDILDHCRRPGPHVRGCWVVDLVLGKS